MEYLRRSLKCVATLDAEDGGELSARLTPIHFGQEFEGRPLELPRLCEDGARLRVAGVGNFPVLVTDSYAPQFEKHSGEEAHQAMFPAIGWLFKVLQQSFACSVQPQVLTPLQFCHKDA